MAGDRDSDVSVDDQLARRLRALDWPKPPAGLAERSLEDFMRRLDEAEAARDAAEADAAAGARRR